MSEIAHNHPPRCCCPDQIDHDAGTYAVAVCPLCTEHGELAQLAEPQPGECPVCHSEIGKQHTDYCRFTGIVSELPMLDLDQFRTQTGAETCPDRDQHDLVTYCGTCHTTFSAAGPSDFRTQTSTPTTHARTELDRATLDATLTGSGYLLNGRRIPPEDVQIVHRGGSHWWEPTRDPHARDVTDWPTSDRWHQDGPDSAHERTQCDPAQCGLEPTPTAQDTPCPCTYNTGPVQHTPSCPEWHP